MSERDVRQLISEGISSAYGSNVAWLTPVFLWISATETPSSASFKTKTICASVCLDALMQLSSPAHKIIKGKFQRRVAIRTCVTA